MEFNSDYIILLFNILMAFYQTSNKIQASHHDLREPVRFFSAFFLCAIVGQILFWLPCYKECYHSQFELFHGTLLFVIIDFLLSFLTCLIPIYTSKFMSRALPKFNKGSCLCHIIAVPVLFHTCQNDQCILKVYV